MTCIFLGSVANYEDGDQTQHISWNYCTFTDAAHWGQGHLQVADPDAQSQVWSVAVQITALEINANRAPRFPHGLASIDGEHQRRSFICAGSGEHLLARPHASGRPRRAASCASCPWIGARVPSECNWAHVCRHHRHTQPIMQFNVVFHAWSRMNLHEWARVCSAICRIVIYRDFGW